MIVDLSTLIAGAWDQGQAHGVSQGQPQADLHDRLLEGQVCARIAGDVAGLRAHIADDLPDAQGVVMACVVIQRREPRGLGGERLRVVFGLLLGERSVPVDATTCAHAQ